MPTLGDARRLGTIVVCCWDSPRQPRRGHARSGTGPLAGTAPDPSAFDEHDAELLRQLAGRHRNRRKHALTCPENLSARRRHRARRGHRAAEPCLGANNNDHNMVYVNVDPSGGRFDFQLGHADSAERRPRGARVSVPGGRPRTGTSSPVRMSVSPTRSGRTSPTRSTA
jgi:hypothetical protein